MCVISILTTHSLELYLYGFLWPGQRVPALLSAFASVRYLWAQPDRDHSEIYEYGLHAHKRAHTLEAAASQRKPSSTEQ